MKFTIFGGRGFIGRHLMQYLRAKGAEVFVPRRNADDAIGRDLGYVVYAIGLTGGFCSRPFDTVEAHVSLMANLLQKCRYESWLYLSSTRVYAGLGPGEVAREDSVVPVLPSSDSLYDLSKLLGEALCLAQASSKVRVARLSNVYGVGQSKSTFLGSILNDAILGNRLIIRESPDSAKDYVSLGDVLPILESIALDGQKRIYNVASGQLLTHADLAKALAESFATSVQFLDGAHRRVFPRIDVDRIASEFGYRPISLRDNLSDLFKQAKTGAGAHLEKLS